jgi:serine/threonine-protein kinase
MIGTKLAHYDITAHLGSGGMGDVYQATDLKLGRSVALKLLPEAFLQDAERTGRFEREARLLASLNHPNIAAIYGIEQSGQRKFLVMELVTGETLTERIKRGPIPLDESLEIAKQIADGLEAAHERGIIHRDLKPANVKITPDGKVKLLDFGLAKAFGAQREAASTPASDENSPTLTIAGTQAGMILGTAAYMSPEQARGKNVDRRADIWAFGVVLYEMLTGERLFGTEEVSDTLVQVLTKTPDLAKVPFKVRKLLARCFEKDSKNRLRDIGEARFLVDDSRADTGPGARHARPLPWMIASALLAVALTATLAALWPRPGESKSLVRLDVDLGPNVLLTAASGANSNGPGVIISPDATRLVYVSQERLYTRRLDEAKATELSGTEGADEHFFSPDGRWVAFFASGELKKTPVAGGAVTSLCPAGANPRGASWGEDGNIIAALNNTGGLSRIPSNGGMPEQLTTPAKGEVTHRWPQILPGGKAMLFTVHTSPLAGFDEATIAVMSLGDHHQKPLQRGGTFGRFLASGHLTYVNRGGLYAVPFDLDRLEVRGTPTLVLEQVAYSTPNGSSQVDFSRTGNLIFRSAGRLANLVTVQWLDGEGKTQPLLRKPGDYGYPALSPDGQRLAISKAEGSNQDIWVYEQQDSMTKLTFDGGIHSNPVWSLDGRYVLFQTPAGISWTGADGAGMPQTLITKSDKLQYPSSFSKPGLLAFYEGIGRIGDIWTVAVESNNSGLRAGKPEPFLQTAANERWPSFSPDGRWLAYSSDKSGNLEVYVRAFPDKASEVKISNAGGMFPMWSPTMRELFFRTDDQIMVAEYMEKDQSIVAQKPRLWSEQRIGGANNRNFSVAPDGKRIAALMPAELSETQQSRNHIIFLENFFDELQRRMPAGR